MKVTNVVSYVGIEQRMFYVKVETDEGITGYGECSPMQVDSVLQIIESVIKPQLIGMDPFDIERIEEKIMRKHYKISGQLLAAAYSGVEIALWDAKAKFLGQPLYNLLGGKYRATIPLYGSSMSRDLSNDQETGKLREGLDRFQFKAVKIKVGPRFGTGLPVDLNEDAEKVRRVREEIGPDCKLMVDGNSSYTYIQAVQLFDKIKQYDIHHYEEPCPYYDVDTYVRLCSTLPVPIHVGEQDWNIFTFRDFIAKGACHLYAADPIKCGGILSAKRAATLCRAFNIHYVPHNTTRGVGFAAALHLASSTPECTSYYEYSIEKESIREQFLTQQFVIEDGFIHVPDGPGLGIDLDEEKMESVLHVVK
ncbi:mandelate racemase/muconate lactonizing enzyme family protein [Paenibacillus radicis (ex Xue et al. 2023)]|uniref:Mandelate racemase/muconate lactonizing enzyme family protein n=1 Tax=Paenibacillus radicis (ex Xue et al. 2023) TaxID=2972489 RepID=A0ABT1YJA8_9BACL|nr:mandelate racemase/muconate lactonizing enzyme family protein [Paenibacillus radicis (ex Xue et al. 2023)]MCR8633280.1 mandelate racemase/muconate lactonizing enzyme family protein [Paenibacillus radicis (ex Xue et al. 2023)]